MPAKLDIIGQSLQTLKVLIERRLEDYFHVKKEEGDIGTTSAEFGPILTISLSLEESVIVLLALLPHIQPTFLEEIIEKFLPQGGDFPAIGGVRNSNHRSFTATGETALFILAGQDLKRRIDVHKLLQRSSKLVKENIIELEKVKDGEPTMSGRLLLTEEALAEILFDKKFTPTFSSDFPAKLVMTKMEWSDVVLSRKTVDQIREIKTWLEHNKTLMNEWGMSKKIRDGYKALFYGPPGTGKTLTASLLGKEFDMPVFRIDLSQVISKYIGETEKNLEKLFHKAENKEWILFFDEADALFGKRSNVQHAHDRYANQEISYLLQRLEDYRGLIILASNFKVNIDPAFVRRFHSVIQYPLPTKEERLDLWKKALPVKASFASDVDLELIAAKYELSGSAIINAIQFASLQAISENVTTISKTSLLKAIKREYEKEDRVFPS